MQRRSSVVSLILLPVAMIAAIVLISKPAEPSRLVEPFGYREQKEIQEQFNSVKEVVDNKKLPGKAGEETPEKSLSMEDLPDFSISKPEAFENTLSTILAKQSAIGSSVEDTLSSIESSMKNWELPDAEAGLPTLEKIPTLDVKMLSVGDASMPSMPPLLDIPVVTYPNLFTKTR